MRSRAAQRHVTLACVGYGTWLRAVLTAGFLIR
jgi:hypothetical protein